MLKGTHSTGVEPRYCSTQGKVSHCQVGVFLAYADPRGHTLLDRELYLYRNWTKDGARLQEVGLAPDTPFATKPQLARTWDAGVPVAWATRSTAIRALRSWRTMAGTTCWPCPTTKICGPTPTSGAWMRSMQSTETGSGIGSVPTRRAQVRLTVLDSGGAACSRPNTCSYLPPTFPTGTTTCPISQLPLVRYIIPPTDPSP
jgi:hypothetical protein